MKMKVSIMKIWPVHSYESLEIWSGLRINIIVFYNLWSRIIIWHFICCHDIRRSGNKITKTKWCNKQAVVFQCHNSEELNCGDIVYRMKWPYCTCGIKLRYSHPARIIMLSLSFPKYVFVFNLFLYFNFTRNYFFFHGSTFF